MKVRDSLYVWIEGNEDKKERSALKSLQKRHIKRMTLLFTVIFLPACSLKSLTFQQKGRGWLL